MSYARTHDGGAIAYSVVGEGDVPIVVAAPLIGQLEIAWEEPAFEQFVSRLAVGARIILFDRRGSGLSDHASASADTLVAATLARDVTTVLDAARIERAVVLGISLGGMTAIQFAADHAARTCALVLVGATARVTRTEGYDVGLDPAVADDWIEAAVRGWGTGASVEADGPTMAGNDRYREWAGRLERHTVAPGGLATTLRASFGYDVRALLPTLNVPTLVVHRRDDHGVTVECGRYLAANIPDATFVELPGVEHTYFLGDHDAMLAAIRTFLDDQVAGGALRSAVRRAERRSAYGFGWSALTPAEREVAGLVAQGHTNAEIARRLGASPYTVDGRLRRIFGKLNVSTRVELTAEHARHHAEQAP